MASLHIAVAAPYPVKRTPTKRIEIEARGDLKLMLRAEETSAMVSFAYAVGSGVMNNPACEQCGREFTQKNSPRLDGTQLIGSSCCVN